MLWIQDFFLRVSWTSSFGLPWNWKIPPGFIFPTKFHRSKLDSVWVWQDTIKPGFLTDVRCWPFNKWSALNIWQWSPHWWRFGCSNRLASRHSAGLQTLVRGALSANYPVLWQWLKFTLTLSQYSRTATVGDGKWDSKGRVGKRQ